MRAVGQGATRFFDLYPTSSAGNGDGVTNVNPQLASINGIGVFAHGELIPTVLTLGQTSGIPAFSAALASIFSNLNLRNFSYSDTANFRTPLNFTSPTNGLRDVDVLCTQPLRPTDYLFLSERNGNSSFEVTPLREDGAPFSEANKLRFGGPGESLIGFTTGSQEFHRQPAT